MFLDDTGHSLRECTALSGECIPVLDRAGAEVAAVARSLSPFFFWRRIARAVEGRWRERSKKLRATATEPQHPADEQDDAVAGEVDTIAERQPAAHDIRSALSIAPPGSRAQQTSVKEPRNDGAIVVNRRAKSKNLNKPKKKTKKA